MNEAVKQEALFALLYISRGDPALGFLEIQAILTMSARNNQERGLTGALVYDGTYFMQYLEGERAEIEALYAHIKKDPRHHDITTVICEPIVARRFEVWTLSNISGAFYLHVLPIVKTLPFDPYKATPEQLLRLISEIVKMA